MKLVLKSQTETHKNSESCTAIEYPMGDEDINGAVVKLDGRYPTKGRVMNVKCKELCYVIEGSGKVVVNGQETILHQGDSILIEPGEAYFWDGQLTMFVPSSPAWYPGQHKEVE